MGSFNKNVRFERRKGTQKACKDIHGEGLFKEPTYIKVFDLCVFNFAKVEDCQISIMFKFLGRMFT